MAGFYNPDALSVNPFQLSVPKIATLIPGFDARLATDDF